jgi:hypothetical protein
VRPSIARRHFQELLQAKQERVKQGPSYPPANPYTGRRDAVASMPHGGDESASPPSLSNAPEPEATFGSSETMHGRGNQGMRRQS